MEILCKADYEQQIQATRDARMKWWREARFGMFVHFGLYSQLQRNEWAMALENWPVAEYEKLADAFCPAPGCAYAWAKLAKEAGMKYMVLTTRHHEGFSLWDSAVNPYNSVNYGCKRDIVREFVDACRAYDLKIGFYSSLMDWHHPDSWRCAFDPEARKRFTDYIFALNRELMSNYGKIDILWYDVPRPMNSYEGWDSLALNQMVRSLQPEIIINNRSHLDEDFGTPEEHIQASERDWEACMTFNGISWGAVDSQAAAPYTYNAQQIIRMLNMVSYGGGNLLLNIGPHADGSVPPEAVAPLKQVGQWLEQHGEAVYGPMKRTNMICLTGSSNLTCKGNTVYLWSWIWPKGGKMILGGFAEGPTRIRCLSTGKELSFRTEGQRLILMDLPERSPDAAAGIAVLALDFAQEPVHHRCSYYPQLHEGKNWAGAVNPNL